MNRGNLRHTIDIISQAKQPRSLMENAYFSRWGNLTEEDKHTARCFDEIIPLLIEWTKLENNSSVLLEAPEDKQTLSKKQIQQLFIKIVQAENYKKEEGNLDNYDPTTSGEGETEKKTKEQASKIKKIVAKKLTDIKDRVQNSKPVENFDNKVENYINELKEKKADNKVVKSAVAIGEYAKEHPTLTNFAIGALTAAATMLATPTGGMAAGMLLRSAVGVMKGEKASTAIGKAAVVAATGAVVGMGVEAIGGLFTDIFVPELDITDVQVHKAAGLKEFNFSVIMDRVGSGGSYFGDATRYYYFLPDEVAGNFQQLLNGASQSPQHMENFIEFLEKLDDQQDAFISRIMDVENLAADAMEKRAGEIASADKIMSGLAAAAQGATQAVAGSKKP